MSEIIIAAVSIVGIGIGSVVGYFIRKQVAQARSNTIEAIAEKKITEAKNKEQELLLNAKEKAIKIIDEAKNDENARRQEIKKLQEIKEKIESAREQAIEKLQSVAGYTKDQAKEELFQDIEKNAAEDLMARTLKFDQVNAEKLENRAREVVINAMQRTACNHAV